MRFPSLLGLECKYFDAGICFIEVLCIIDAADASGKDITGHELEHMLPLAKPLKNLTLSVL